MWFQNRRAKWRKQEKSTGSGGSGNHGYNPYGGNSANGPTVLPSPVISNNVSNSMHGGGPGHHAAATAAALSAGPGGLFNPHAALAAAAYRKPLLDHPNFKSSPGYLNSASAAMFGPNAFSFANAANAAAAAAFPFRDLSASYPQLFHGNPSANAITPFANPFLSPYASASNSFQNLLASLSSSHNRAKIAEEAGIRSPHFMNVQQTPVDRLNSPPLSLTNTSQNNDTIGRRSASPSSVSAPSDRRNTSIAALRLKAREHEMAMLQRKEANCSRSSNSSNDSSMNNGTTDNTV